MTESTQNMEQDMRQVFDNALHAISTLRDKTISAVVSHSHQAREISELREKLDALNQRMTSVVNEAQQIRQDLHSVIVERDKYKKDAEEALNLAEGYERERNEARTRLDEMSESVRQAHTEMTDLRRENANLSSLVERHRGDLEWTQRQSSEWRQKHDDALARSIKAEEELKQAQDKLSRLQGVVKELFPDAPKPVVHPTGMDPSDLPRTAPRFHSDYQVEGTETGNLPSIQAINEEPVKGVNERIDGQEPKPEEQGHWWTDKKRETGF